MDEDLPIAEAAEPLGVLTYAPEPPPSRLVWRVMASLFTWAALLLTIIGAVCLLGGEVHSVTSLGPLLVTVAGVAIGCGVWVHCPAVWVLNLVHLTLCFGFLAVTYRCHWNLAAARVAFVWMATVWASAGAVATPFVVRACGQF